MKPVTIDFYELSFLAEACIPPVPIARASFWSDLISKHYHKMTPNERHFLHGYILRSNRFDLANIDCLLFAKRFDQNNQYRDISDYKHRIEANECFLMDDRYYTDVHRSIVEEYITKVEKIEFKG